MKAEVKARRNRIFFESLISLTDPAMQTSEDVIPSEKYARNGNNLAGTLFTFTSEIAADKCVNNKIAIIRFIAAINRLEVSGNIVFIFRYI